MELCGHGQMETILLQTPTGWTNTGNWCIRATDGQVDFKERSNLFHNSSYICMIRMWKLSESGHSNRLDIWAIHLKSLDFILLSTSRVKNKSVFWGPNTTLPSPGSLQYSLCLWLVNATFSFSHFVPLSYSRLPFLTLNGCVKYCAFWGGGVSQSGSSKAGQAFGQIKIINWRGHKLMKWNGRLKGSPKWCTLILPLPCLREEGAGL